MLNKTCSYITFDHLGHITCNKHVICPRWSKLIDKHVLLNITVLTLISFVSVAKQLLIRDLFYIKR